MVKVPIDKINMVLSRLYLVVLLLCLYEIRGIFGDDDDIVILPLRSYTCDDADPLLNYNINIRNLNDEGIKVLDVELELEEDFTERWKFVMTIDKWNNGDWDLNFYDADGPVCQVINQYVSRAWAKVRQEIEPQIPEPCYALKDHYKLTDFNVSQTDYDIPVVLLGTYRVTGQILDEFGTELICQVIEVETYKSR